MADPVTFETAFYATQAESRANTSRLAAPNGASGEIQVAVVEYTTAGSEAATDKINLCVLPAGAVPLPHLSSIMCADPGTTLTIDVGTAANADGWFDGIDVKAGGIFTPAAGTLPAWIAPTAITADTGSTNAVVYATLAAAETVTANVKIYFALAYRLAK